VWVADGGPTKHASAASPLVTDLIAKWTCTSLKLSTAKAHDDYGVILKDDGLETEIGSIGIQRGSADAEHLGLGIDTIIPMREVDAQGTGKTARTA
jgi:hypothetical protein